METQHHHQLKLSVTPSMAVGLRILIQKAITTHNSVVTSTIRSSPILTPSPAPVNFSCFLRSCHLCRKELRPDKDIYMYRGDLGFCSIQCRERQMVADEMKNLEESRKRMIASSARRHCGSSDGRPTSEISLLREELRWRLNQLPARKIRPVFS